MLPQYIVRRVNSMPSMPPQNLSPALPREAYPFIPGACEAGTRLLFPWKSMRSHLSRSSRVSEYHSEKYVISSRTSFLCLCVKIMIAGWCISAIMLKH
jgi:hypothetical protein